MTDAGEQFDYVIVGGGTAGCVLADRLSEVPTNRVCLVESGADGIPLASRVPAGQALLVGNPRYDWGYTTEPDPSRGGVEEKWAAARLLGGGSSVNGMIFVRGHYRDYDLWREMGCIGWGYEDVLPYFRKSEDFAGGDDLYRGSGGPVSVGPVRSPHALAHALLEGAREAGFRTLLDINGIDASPDGDGREGFSIVQVSQRRGWRASTALTYLRRARRRPNLVVKTNHTAVRIIMDGRRARGVACIAGAGTQREITCRGEVIVCTGSLSTPGLLMRSGIGSAVDLAGLGIEPVADLPGVGRNLREHIGAALGRDTRIETLNRDLRWTRLPLKAIEYALFGRGPASTPIAQAMGFIRSRPDGPIPDAIAFMIPIAYEFDARGQLALAKKSAFTLAVSLNYPRTTGQVRLRDREPASSPVIDFRAAVDECDIEDLVDACMIGSRILRTGAFTRLLANPAAIPDAERDRDHLRETIRKSVYVFFHPVGTAKTGTDREAVVDPELKVAGIERLRIADASIMPTLPGANTNATVLMIAEKAADMIRRSAAN
jgi:choline dehydrogenase